MFFCFSITDESGEQCMKGPTTRGVWGHAPPENFEVLVLWNAISSVLRGQILSKCCLNQLSFFMLIFIGVTSRRSSQFYFIQVVRFLKLLWISLSAKYTLCGVIVWSSIIRIHLKISEQLSKSEIFLSRTHIDRDSGFSSKIGRTPTRSGWLNSLHRRTTSYGLICV